MSAAMSPLSSFRPGPAAPPVCASASPRAMRKTTSAGSAGGSTRPRPGAPSIRRRRREACHAAEGVAALTVLETERLILKPVAAAHEEALHRLHRDALIVRALWDGRLPTRQHTRERLALYPTEWRHLGIGHRKGVV